MLGKHLAVAALAAFAAATDPAPTIDPWSDGLCYNEDFLGSGEKYFETIDKINSGTEEGDALKNMLVSEGRQCIVEHKEHLDQLALSTQMFFSDQDNDWYQCAYRVVHGYLWNFEHFTADNGCEVSEEAKKCSEEILSSWSWKDQQCYSDSGFCEARGYTYKPDFEGALSGVCYKNCNNLDVPTDRW